MKSITIGRSNSCDIVVADNNISRVHAEISISGGRYIYKDISKNGSTLNGEYINNRSIEITPGAPIVLANHVPLPWAQIYAMLPLKSARPFEAETKCESYSHSVQPAAPAYVPLTPAKKDEPSIGLNILAFLIPLVGWIMYFSMKEETPRRASQIATWAWVGFAINMISVLINL